MNAITQLHIQGFRRLADVKIEMRPLCVAIGANGSGKSSLLDVYLLLAASAEGKLAELIRDFGGLRTVLPQMTGYSDSLLGISIEGTRPTIGGRGKRDRFRYSLSIGPLRYDFQIVNETLYYNSSADSLGTLPLIEYDVDQPGRRLPEEDIKESVLSRTEKKNHTQEWFRKSVASASCYGHLDVGARSLVRMPQPVQPADTPGLNGEDLISCLYTMRETYRDQFEDVEAALHAAFPHFERLEFPPVSAGTLAMLWKDSTCSRPLYMNQLSEGTLRFLWLVTLLHCPGLPDCTLIDEPEVSLHPEMLRILAELLREASTRSQIIVATHSDNLVRFLKPEEVLTFDIGEDGAAKATWADEHDLKHWLDEYTLDELWRMGRIGGRA